MLRQRPVSAAFRTSSSALAVFVVLVLAGAPARAQSESAKKKASALQAEGLKLMQKGDNWGALDKFNEAFRLVPSPKILFNRGKAHHALGEEVEALSDFERFLDEAPYAPKESRDEASRTVETLRPKLAYIEIQSDEPGSDVTLDGKSIGSTPLARPVVVAPGSHEVKMTKSGMKDETRRVSPIAGQKVRVSIRMVSNEPPPPPITPPIAPPPTENPATNPPITVLPPKDGTTPPPPPPPPPPRQPAGTPWQIPAAVVTAGAGVLLAGGGVIAQVLSSSKYTDFNTLTNAPNPSKMCNQMISNNGGDVCTSLLTSAQNWHTYAIIGFVASGAALATSLVFYLTAPSSPGPGHEVAAACVPSNFSGGSCVLRMAF
jgi:hypothetical protein